MSLKLRLSRGGAKAPLLSYRCCGFAHAARWPLYRTCRHLQPDAAAGTSRPDQAQRRAHQALAGCRRQAVGRVARFLGQADIIPMPEIRETPKQSAPRAKTLERMREAEEAEKAKAEADASAEEAPAEDAPPKRRRPKKHRPRRRPLKKRRPRKARPMMAARRREEGGLVLASGRSSGGRRGGGSAAVASSARVQGAADRDRVCVGASRARTASGGRYGSSRSPTFRKTLPPTDRIGRSGKPAVRDRHQSIRGGMVIATLEGVADRNAAEALKGLRLYVPKDALPEPDEDEFYHADLLGLEVVQEERRSGP